VNVSKRSVYVCCSVYLCFQPRSYLKLTLVQEALNKELVQSKSMSHKVGRNLVVVEGSDVSPPPPSISLQLYAWN